MPLLCIDIGNTHTHYGVVANGQALFQRAHGYEGGIIAPGVGVMRRYLHEQTALLPLLDDSLEVSGVIGRSTVEAMRIGTVVGFGGMIQALLDAVLTELARRG
jgi:type III pantothenate kinase